MAETTLVAEDLFGREAVHRLTAQDFLLDSTIPIGIRWNNCMVILFYGNNAESQNLVQIFANVARQFIGPAYGAVNVTLEQDVVAAFVKTIQTPGPFRTFGWKGYPFILAYQKGYPVGFYNGGRSVTAIGDWALTLACHPTYLENIQLAGSVHIDQDYEMGAVNEQPQRVVSTEYTIGNPIRRYDPTTGIELTGSQAAAVQAQREAAERAAAGVAVTAPPEAGETAAGVIPGSETLGEAPGVVAPAPATPAPGTVFTTRPGGV